MNVKTRNLLDFLLNLILLFTTVSAIGYYFTAGPDVLGSRGITCFRYFTTDSNVIAALSSAILLVYNVRRFRDPASPIPKAVMVFRYASVSAVALTLITVLFFLAPKSLHSAGISGALAYFAGNTFCLHLSTPLLAIIAFLFFEPDHKLNRLDVAAAVLPTVIYSFVYYVMVVPVRLWYDWYGFTFGGRLYLIPFSALAMYLVSTVIALLLRKFRRTEKNGK